MNTSSIDTLKSSGKDITLAGELIITTVKSIVQKYCLDIEDVFFRFDPEGTGYLTRLQFTDFAKAFNPKIQQDEIENLFNVFDDGNQKMCLLEFCNNFS